MTPAYKRIALKPRGLTTNPGIFEIMIDDAQLEQFCERAARNKGRIANIGPLRVKFIPCGQDQQEFLRRTQRVESL